MWHATSIATCRENKKASRFLTCLDILLLPKRKDPGRTVPSGLRRSSQSHWASKITSSFRLGWCWTEVSWRWRGNHIIVQRRLMRHCSKMPCAWLLGGSRREVNMSKTFVFKLKKIAYISRLRKFSFSLKKL